MMKKEESNEKRVVMEDQSRDTVLQEEGRGCREE
jgi:hypothetical protein